MSGDARWMALLGGILVVTACASTSLTPVIASSPGSIGIEEQRVLIALVDIDTNEMAASEDLEVVATLRDRIGSPLGTHPGEFVWLVPEVRGLYSFEFEIPGPGTYQVTIEGDGLGELGPVGFVAVDDPLGPGRGDPAPLSETRTAADTPLDDLTSDPDPDPAFYEMTVAEAVSDGPSVIVFATPAWCESQACGPLLDQVKALSDDFPELNFVHVEVYEDIHVSSIDELVAVPAVDEWGLVSEPWVFVTDESGMVSALFEGAASDAELRSAFAEVAP
ncbi:MAG: hypothetical protein L0Z49_06260 [Actinobacteria bacterium]|nr:hypothetical protein [Actinomycetota bacterium]